MSVGTRFEAAYDATFFVALADRLDSVREVRNQKYAGMGRTPADLRDAKAAFEAFSALAIDWLQTHHAALLLR